MSRELSFHRGTVRSQRLLGPHLRRLVIGGAGADGWRSSGVPDEAVLLVVPDPATGTLTFPCDYPGQDDYELTRWYTVRSYDAARDELTVDVVEHARGVVVDWARQALPGDEVGVSSVRHWYDRPDDAAWQLLLCDLTGLPAVGRILEERSAGLPTTVLVEVPEGADRIELPDVGADVHWKVNPGESRLLDLLLEHGLPDTPGYVFVAGEAGATRDVRRHLRHTLGLPAGRYHVIGYWRANSEEWVRRYEQARIDLRQIYAEAEARGVDAEELADEVDRRLLEAGL